jgi:hypothetical protein
MSVRKLNEHLKEELFNKEKRETPKVDKDRVIKTKPKLVKESVLGQKNIPSPPSPQEPRVIKEGEQPVKKKKPYYRKKYNKPKPVEIVPEPVKSKNYFIHGLIVGVVVTFVLCKLYFDYN